MKVTIDDVICKAETDRAILVEIEGDDFWIPQSQVDDDSEVWRKGDEGTLVITEWIAKQKGIL
jgi:hypothetical protein